MKYYSRITKSVSDKGIVVPLENLSEVLQERIKEYPLDDHYHSLYVYPEAILDYYKTHGNSIAGYTEDCYANYLFFDFDCRTSLETAKNDVRELLNALNKNYKVDVNKSVQVYFSGNKGFHVVLHLSEYLDKNYIENICLNICPNLETMDRVIYNITRIVRVPNTVHIKTKLYKVEIDPKELKNLTEAQLHELAKKPVVLNRVLEPYNNIEKFEQFKIINVKKIVVDADEIDRNTRIRGLKAINFDKCPKNTPRCIYALQYGVMVPGERSHVFLALARWFRNQGYPKELTHHTLKGIAELNAKLYPEHEPVTKEELWDTVIQSAYNKLSTDHQHPDSPGTAAENKVLLSYCDAIGEHTTQPCSLHKRILTKEVYNTDDLYLDFKKYASNIEKNTIKTGIDFIDSNMIISRGEMTILSGANGSGKTSCALNLLENSSNNNVPAIFFSLDMHRTQVFLKLALRCTDYNNKQIKDFIKNDPDGVGKKIKNAVKERYKNVHFFFNSTLTIEELRDRIFDVNRKINVEAGLVLVDYAGRLSGPYSDSYANAKYNALKLKETADITNAAWLVLTQVSRNKGDGNTPLRSSRVSKDSGDYEEAAANVITMWRPFMNQRNSNNDNVIKMFLAKNRMGPQLEGPVWWNGPKGVITNMTSEELMEYEAEREQEEIAAYNNKKGFPS